MKETWATWPSMDATRPSKVYPQSVHYKATFDQNKITHPPAMPKKWRPSTTMPRWASRIEREIVSVRAERVQDISEADAIKEGIDWAAPTGVQDEDREDPRVVGYPRDGGSFARDNFMRLWDSINAKRGHKWDANEWVWAVEIKQIGGGE